MGEQLRFSIEYLSREHGDFFSMVVVVVLECLLLEVELGKYFFFSVDDQQCNCLLTINIIQENKICKLPEQSWIQCQSAFGNLAPDFILNAWLSIVASQQRLKIRVFFY